MSAPMQIRLFGLRRSGTHAVADWLRRAVGGPVVFLNDCRTGDPFDSFSHLETPAGARHGPQFCATDWFPDWPAGREWRSHVVTYEDRHPDDTATTGWRAPFATLVLHRSFLNWLASYYRLVAVRFAGRLGGVARPERVAERFGLWARLADAAGAVSYDAWARCDAARGALLRRLGLPGTDPGLGTVSDYGGGPSFAGDDRGRRWAALADDGAFRDLVGRAATDAPLLSAVRRHYPDDAARILRYAATGELTEEA